MKPNSQRATNAIYSLYATLFGSVLLILVGFYSLYLLSNSSVQFSMEEYDSYVMLLAIIGVVYFVLYILCAVLFIMWFRRAYFNLHTLLPSSQFKYTEGWAAGAWFIPIFNLWGPFQIATELFTKSEALLVEHNLMERKPNFHLVKNWWWGLWVTASVLSRASSRMNDDPSLLFIGTVLALIGAAITIGAGLLAVRMIQNYSQMEALLVQIPDLDGGARTMIITDDDLLDSGI